MKKQKPEKLTLDQAASKLAILTQGYFDQLPPKERQKRIKAFKRLASTAKDRLDSVGKRSKFS